MGYQEYGQMFAFGLGMWAVILLRFLVLNTLFESVIDVILVIIATFYLVMAAIMRRQEMREDGQ